MYLKCRVLQQVKVGAEAFALDLDVQEMAGLSRPGQFVMVRCWEGDDPFLMRPFSINSMDRKNGIMTLLYQVRGRGTSLMSALRPADSVAVLGPLGRGFPVREGASRVALIGRGMGIAPLLLLAQDYAAHGTELHVYLSARSEEGLFNRSQFERLGARVTTTTASSLNVTDRMVEDCRSLKFDAAYSCGSRRLGLGMKELHLKYGFPAYVSLEEHMACGLGACKGCACRTRRSEAGGEYALVCKDGPVFDVDEVL